MINDKGVSVETVRGKKKVKIQRDKYGEELHVMTNGFQWTGMGIDSDILEMIIECIEEYKKTVD